MLLRIAARLVKLSNMCELRNLQPISPQHPTLLTGMAVERIIVMMNALRAKAECCDQFKRELLSTGNKPLFETSPN